MKFNNNNASDPHLLKVERPKVSGLNHLWDGPLDITGFPMGKGSSSGKNGKKVKQDNFPYKSGPITQRAKCF